MVKPLYWKKAKTHLSKKDKILRKLIVKYKGSLETTVNNYLGGLRSTCTYTNSKNLEDLEKNCKFILVNNQYNSNLVNGK